MKIQEAFYYINLVKLTQVEIIQMKKFLLEYGQKKILGL